VKTPATQDVRNLPDHELTPTLLEACRRSGLNPAGARLLRDVVNAIFLLPAESIIARIARRFTPQDQVRRMVRTTRWLGDAGIPVAQLVEGIEQPTIVTGGAVTFWRYLPQGDAAPPPVRHLGESLRRLHSLDPPPDTPQWDPIQIVRTCLSNADATLNNEDRAFLVSWCNALEQQLAHVEYVLPESVIHGDAWVGNLLHGPEGPVWCDFDAVCLGPPEWDLVPTAVTVLRLGHPRSVLRELAEAYGFDVTSWSGFPLLRQLRELTVLSGVAPALAANPSIGHEFRRRIAGLRVGSDSLWRPYR
jgi:aminoglycoside phosphotransferase (APT) family kinase protein